jgi:hypothetical protein
VASQTIKNVVPSALRANAATGVFPLHSTAERVLIHCTAIANTPTLDVVVQYSNDGGATWTASPGSPATQMLAVGEQYVRVTPPSDQDAWVRGTWTVGNAAGDSATFSIDEEYDAYAPPVRD